jgi:hypothetical protein
MTQPLPDPPPPHETPRLHRGLAFGLRRHRAVALALFCLTASAILLAAPFLKRSYAMAGTLRVTVRPFEAIPDLSRIVDTTARELGPFAQEQRVALEVSPAAADGSVRAVRFSSSDSSHNAAFVHVQKVAERFSEMVRHRVDEAVADYGSSLTKQGTRLDTDETATVHELETFRIAHRGALPDDPDSILKQYEKVSTQLDDKQSRLRLLSEQITRLEEYKKGTRPLAPAPIPAASNNPSPAPAPAAAADPEIVSLTAQLQLMADQIDEQLNKLGRTEQHPYVVDLKKKKADLQKKLDAAKERVAAGRPPPPDAHLPTPAGATPANDPSLVAAQAADMQLLSLRAERDDVDVQVRTLVAQRDAMQKSVDGLAGIRREYGALNDKLADIKKSRQELAAKKEAYNRQFGGGEIAAAGIADVSTLGLDQSSADPVWPKLPAVYATAVTVGLLSALAIAWLLARLDRTLHSPQEAADILNTPILGAVSTIRSPSGRHAGKLYHGILEPAAMVALVAILLTSFYLCHRHLTNPAFGQDGPRDPARMLLSFNSGGAR